MPLFAAPFRSSTARLRIWTLRIWGFRGPGFRSARQMLCGDTSCTAKLRIWTLRIWGFRGPGFRSARQMLCGDASPLFLNHFCKHLSCVLGRTELCHEVQNPGPPKDPKSSAMKTTIWHCSTRIYLFKLPTGHWALNFRKVKWTPGPDTFEKYRGTPPFLLLYFCKSMPSVHDQFVSQYSSHLYRDSSLVLGSGVVGTLPTIGHLSPILLLSLFV